MSNYQFPPSSPLLGGNEHNIDSDPFAVQKLDKASVLDRQLKSRHFPTPNPSSTTGRSSSPIRGESSAVDLAHKPIPSKKNVSFQLDSVASSKSNKLVNDRNSTNKSTNRVRINRDFNVLDPDANVLRVPLNFEKTGSTILVGRSSKSCDYHFKTSDRTVSRTHLGISAEGDNIAIECLGFSGFGMRIPKACLVYGTDKSNDYMLMEAKSANQSLSFKDLKELGLKVTPRTIRLDANHTEFFVNRNERVTLPKLDNILIQVRDNVMLLNPKEDEEDVTDDELPVLKPRVVLDKVEAPSAQHNEEPKIATQETKVQDDNLAKKKNATTLPFKQKSPEVTDFNLHSTPIKSGATSLLSTPIKPNSTLAPTPLTPAKLNVRATSEEPTPSYSFIDKSDLKFEIYSENEHDNDNDNDKDVNESPMRPLVTPLRDVTNSLNVIEAQLKKHASNEPHKTMKKRKLHPSPEPEVFDQSCIESLTNISEINNVLLNHLAFSRLSSTPASFLNTISALTSHLTLEQMRVILHNLKPVGVIYREGKDAAGKPLEEEYYYQPEEDDDNERPKLVASIKGHGGLRSCRRTHKQYYWKKPAPKKK